MAVLYTNGQAWQELIKEGLKKNGEYTYKDKRISVTAIKDEFRPNWLKRRHNHEIVESMDDTVWKLTGNSFHKYMEELYMGFREVDFETYSKFSDIVSEAKTVFDMESGEKHYYLKPFLREQKLEYKCKQSNWTLSGVLDVYDVINEEIIDWKTASVNKYKFNDWEDYIKQLERYGIIIRSNGYPVKSGRIVAFFRDWIKSEAERDSSYPQSPFYEFKIDLGYKLDNKEEEYVEDYISEFSKYENVPDSELPPCTDDYKSFGGITTYALMKNANKRATKVFDSLQSANEYFRYNQLDLDKKNTYKIVERPREEKRCQKYCDVCFACDYFIKNHSKFNVVDAEGKVIAGFRDEEKASKYIELIKKDNTLQVVKVERNEENEE